MTVCYEIGQLRRQDSAFRSLLEFFFPFVRREPISQAEALSVIA